MNLKTILICYIFIFAINLSKTTKIQEIIPNYPFPSHLEKYYNLFASQSGLPVLEKLDSKKLEVFNEQEKFINKIIDLGNELPELLPDTVKSFAQNLSSLGLSSGEILLSAGLEVLNYNNPYISSVNDIRSYIFQYKKDKKDELNNKNNIISYIIQQNLSKTKYNIIIKDEIEKGLEQLIKEKISNFDFKDFINKYLTKGKKWEKLNSIFKEDIDSINFILLGNTGSGKSRLINDILDLQSGKDGPFVNQKSAEPTTMGYEKYGNLSKKGIELIDSRGAESNEKYDMKISFQNLTEYFKEQIMLNNSMFIYSFIYLSESNSFSESDFLKNLVKNHYNKIPLKIIFTKSKNIDQIEMLNNTVRKEMKIKNTKNTKFYFLQSYKDGKYKENINNFLKDLIEELDEEKLKDIYNYYYSLNIFENFKKLILIDNIKGILLCQISDEIYIDYIDPLNYITAKLILDLNTLLGGININFEKTRQKMKNIYNIVLNELEKDRKNSNLYEDYELKNYENKSVIDFLLNKLFSQRRERERDYNDIIFKEISKKINLFIIDIYLKEIKEKLVNNPIEIEHYPNFANIRTNIIQNYIKDYSQIKSKKLIYIIVFIIFIALVVFIIYYYSKKRPIFKKPEKDRELDDLDNSYVRKI